MKNTKGNALFLILIAVALFAALSYAVTQSGRGGSGIDKEQAAIISAQITQYGSQISQAVARLRIIGGCSDTQISFHYDSDGDGTLETNGDDDYYNPNAPSDFSCHLFHVNGSGLSHQTPPNGTFSITGLPKWGEQYTYTGSTCVAGIGSGDAPSCFASGPETAELLLILTGVDDEICRNVNQNLEGVSSIPTMPGANGNFYDISEADGFFQGVYNWGPSNPTISGHFTYPDSTGRATFCFLDETPNANVLYHTILAR